MLPVDSIADAQGAPWLPRVTPQPCERSLPDGLRVVPGAGPITARLLLCLLLTLPGAAAADDSRYQDYPVGSRAMALGGAFVALSDDPSGLFYNPAGICDARRLNVSVSASLYGIERLSQASAPTLPITGGFSLGGALSTINVIPGEAGLIKGEGALDERGTPWAWGFDVTVPGFRSSGNDIVTTEQQLHNRLVDRTFDAAAGVGFRYSERINLGLALHYVLRLFEQDDDALLLLPGGAETAFKNYHAQTKFQHSSVMALAGLKARVGDDWLLGAALGSPSVRLFTSGSVQVQDVSADPSQPAGSRTTVSVVQDDQVEGATQAPLLLRVGAAHVEPHRWTLSGQLTFHAPAHYDRVLLDPEVERRLRLQHHVDRGAVLDANLGGEYLLNADYTLALGLFSDRSGAQALQADASGKLLPGSSRLDNISLYGGTATLGILGSHSITRFGISGAYGTGEVAQAADPSGITDPDTYRRVEARQLFLYVFLASTFRY